MNYWTELSIEYASQKSYLDDLFQVYPTIPEGIREINQVRWTNIEKAFKEEIDLDKYWNNLLHLTQKKFNLLASERESFKKINKVKAYLAYKGYEFDLMNDAIETVKTKD